MAKIPRMPFPSFTLVLSRQEVGDNNESNNGIQQRNTSNRDVEPPVDLLMVSCNHRFLSVLRFVCRIQSWPFLGGYRKHLILAYRATIVAGKWYVQVCLSVELESKSIHPINFAYCIFFLLLAWYNGRRSVGHRDSLWGTNWHRGGG